MALFSHRRVRRQPELLLLEQSPEKPTEYENNDRSQNEDGNGIDNGHGINGC